MPDLTATGIILLLILLNALFVAAEFAIVGAPRASIDRLAAKGHRTAKLVSRILHDPQLQDRYIATAQLGITFASLGLGMYGEHALAIWIFGLLESLDAPSWIAAHALASVLSITFLTYLHIVLGEMVPKTLALQHAELAVLWVTPPMLWIKTIFYPLVIGLNGIGNAVLKLMRIQRQLSSGYFLTPEELQYVIQESQAGGMLRAESGEILRDLLKFGDLTAAEVMVPRVHIIGIPLGSGPGRLREIICSSRHSRYPVYDGDLDHIAGILHIKDLFRLLVAGHSVSRDNLRDVSFVPETASLEVVLEAMRAKRTHMAVVMDEHGGTAGLVSIEDLYEEVVGEIEEETSGPPETYWDDKGRLHASGTVRVDEIGELLGMALEHEEVITVSGLVLMLLNRRPKVGDSVTFGNVRFEVCAVRGRGVAECIVTPQA